MDPRASHTPFSRCPIHNPGDHAFIREKEEAMIHWYKKGYICSFVSIILHGMRNLQRRSVSR